MIVDRLTKSAHFLPVNVKDSLEKLAKLHVDEIVRLHGVPVSIVSDRDPRFTSRFWPSLQTVLGTHLHFSTAFHPQTDGQSERTIQTLEDMLRACVMEFKGSWDTHLAPMEFAYNNSYQAIIEMAPFEALYGWKCRSPSCWMEVCDRELEGPELIRETSEKVPNIQEIEVDKDLSYEEVRVVIVDRQLRKLRNKEIDMIKVQWRNHEVGECTWESVQSMKDKYPQLFEL